MKNLGAPHFLLVHLNKKVRRTSATNAKGWSRVYGFKLQYVKL